MTIEVQLQSASGRCESVRVEERSNDSRTMDDALRTFLREHDPRNEGGWRPLSLGAPLWGYGG